MASVSLVSNWNCNFNTDELRLVLKALGGRLTNPTEIAKAKDLGDRLTKQRCNATEEAMEYANATLAKVEEVSNG